MDMHSEVYPYDIHSASVESIMQFADLIANRKTYRREDELWVQLSLKTLIYSSKISTPSSFETRAKAWSKAFAATYY